MVRHTLKFPETGHVQEWLIVNGTATLIEPSSRKTMNKNTFDSRIAQQGRVVTFRELRNGDVFKLAGDDTNLQYRKMDSKRALNPQSGNWVHPSEGTPVVLVDAVMEIANTPVKV